MNMEKYLPIGTVVMLKGGSKRIMISGFCCVSDNDDSKVYDYTGCLFPEGFLSSSKNLLFNHEQIDKVYYLGLQDDEEKLFKEKLVKAMETINSKNEKKDENEVDKSPKQSANANNVTETLDLSLE